MARLHLKRHLVLSSGAALLELVAFALALQHALNGIARYGGGGGGDGGGGGGGADGGDACSHYIYPLRLKYPRSMLRMTCTTTHECERPQPHMLRQRRRERRRVNVVVQAESKAGSEVALPNTSNTAQQQQQQQQQTQQQRNQGEVRCLAALPEHVEVVEAQWGDLDKVAQLLVKQFTGHTNVVWSAVLTIKELDRLQQNFRNGDDRHVMLLARDNASGVIVGVVDVDGRNFPPEKQKDCPTPYLSDLAVAKEHQRQGIGRCLVTACEDIIASRWGYNTLHLKVAADNTAAISLYQSRGYSILLPEDGSGQILLGKKIELVDRKVEGRSV